MGDHMCARAHARACVCVCVCDRCGNFNFATVKFPCLCGSVPLSPVCGVCVSRLIRWACCAYESFLRQGRLLAGKVILQGCSESRLFEVIILNVLRSLWWPCLRLQILAGPCVDLFIPCPLLDCRFRAGFVGKWSCLSAWFCLRARGGCDRLAEGVTG
jgi:hypothetical protein